MRRSGSSSSPTPTRVSCSRSTRTASGPGRIHRSRQPLPRPPAETDVQTRAVLTLETNVNPPADGFGGLTQLETWLWCDDPGIVDVEARTSGSASRAEVGITELVWTITGPDGTDERRTTTCGTEPDPNGDGDGAAATWTPNATGEHQITLSATWNGTWTAEFYLDRYGWITAGPFPLDPLTITGETLTYPVVEIQTVGGRPDE